MSKVFRSLLTLAVVIGIASLSVRAEAAVTLVVDGDGFATAANCDDPTTVAHTTIQAAVDAAATGDTVFVCPGTYDEQVVISGKDLELDGSGPATIIQPSSATVLDTHYTYPTCVLPGWGGIKLAPVVLVQNSAATAVDDLRIDGSLVTSLPAGAARLSGVLFGESGGSITDLEIDDIKTTGYAARTYVIDVSACEGTARSVNVEGNTVDDFARAAIQAQGDDLTATIDGNTIIGPGTIGPANVPNGIVFIQDATGSASGNTISALHHTGSPSLSGGFLVFSATEAGGVSLEDNEVFDVDDGVLLAANTQNVTVGPDNDVHNNLKGVRIENGANNNDIIDNAITSNSIVGIELGGSQDTNPGTNAGVSNEAHGNAISGNADGVVNHIGVANVFDAEMNWWGDPSGPSGAGPGSGDSVEADVDFTPWCANVTCTASASTPGSSPAAPVTMSSLARPATTRSTVWAATTPSTAAAATTPSTVVLETTS